MCATREPERSQRLQECIYTFTQSRLGCPRHRRRSDAANRGGKLVPRPGFHCRPSASRHISLPMSTQPQYTSPCSSLTFLSRFLYAKEASERENYYRSTVLPRHEGFHCFHHLLSTEETYHHLHQQEGLGGRCAMKVNHAEL